MSWRAERESKQRGGLTVEVMLYAAIFGAGLVLRLAALGKWPLLDQEAALALDAWRYARGLLDSVRGHSPLLFHVNALLSFLSGGGDAWARLASVFFGSILVLLPYGLRRFLGRLGALAAALVLALSPSLIYFSWAVDGSIVVSFCALALVVVVAQTLEGDSSAGLWLIAPLLGLAVASGPLAYSMLAMVASFVAWLWWTARFRPEEAALRELAVLWERWCAEGQVRWRGVAAVGVLGLGIVFAFGYNPAGLQMTLDQFGQWLGAFQVLNMEQWYRLPLLLLVYESLPLAVGIAGMVAARGQRGLIPRLLRYWFTFALLLSVLPGYRPPSQVLMVVLPLVLGAAGAMQRLWDSSGEALRRPLLWALLALSLAAGASVFIHLVGYLTTPVSQYVLRIAALVVFAVAAHAFVWTLTGPEVPAGAAVSAALVLLLLFWVRAGVRLNYQRGRDPVEPMVVAATSPDLLALADRAVELSSHVAGDARVLAWQVDQRLEIPLAWYLRGFESVEYFRSLPADLAGSGVITPAEVGGPGDYVGLRFVLRSTWAAAPASLTDWLGWWSGKRATLPGQRVDEAVVLWVRPPL